VTGKGASLVYGATAGERYAARGLTRRTFCALAIACDEAAALGLALPGERAVPISLTRVSEIVKLLAP